MTKTKRMPTLWEVPDELRERVAKLIGERDPPKHTGREREDARKTMDALIFRIRTGCRWNHNYD